MANRLLEVSEELTRLRHAYRNKLRPKDLKSFDSMITSLTELRIQHASVEAAKREALLQRVVGFIVRLMAMLQ